MREIIAISYKLGYRKDVVAIVDDLSIYDPIAREKFPTHFSLYSVLVEAILPNQGS